MKSSHPCDKLGADSKNQPQRALVCDIMCGEPGLVARSLKLTTSSMNYNSICMYIYIHRMVLMFVIWMYLDVVSVRVLEVLSIYVHFFARTIDVLSDCPAL